MFRNARLHREIQHKKELSGGRTRESLTLDGPPYSLADSQALLAGFWAQPLTSSRHAQLKFCRLQGLEMMDLSNHNIGPRSRCITLYPITASPLLPSLRTSIPSLFFSLSFLVRAEAENAVCCPPPRRNRVSRRPTSTHIDASWESAGFSCSASRTPRVRMPHRYFSLL